MLSYRDIERRYALRQFLLRLRSYGVVLFALLLSVSISLFWAGESGQGMDRWVLRQLFAVRGALLFPKEIVIVGIGDRTFEKYGIPLPRSVIAEGLEKIAAAKPKFLVIDASFDAEDLPVDSEANTRIAAALSAVPSSVKSGVYHSATGDEGSQIVFPVQEAIHAHARFQLPMIARSTAGRVEFITVDTRPHASLANKIPLSPVVQQFYDLSIMPDRSDRVNFYGPPGTVPSVSFRDIVEKDARFVRKMLAEKLIFLGPYSKDDTGNNSDQLLISASSKPMYGVEIHATIAGNLIERSWIRQIDYVYQSALVWGVSFVTFLLVFFFSPGRAGRVIFSLLLILTIVDYLLFSWGRVWVGGLATLWLVAVGAILLAAFWAEHALQKTEKRIARYGGEEH